MSFIGDIFSGDKGAGYEAPFAPIMTPLGTPEHPEGLKDAAGAQYDQFGNLVGNQNNLAQMLLAQAQGGGPNPAAAQLQQATNANQGMTAGTIAATKGIDPALAARQAAMAGGIQQQQAAAQGAQLRAQQQLAAQGSLQQLYGQQGQQNLQQQNILQGAIANLNNANVANVSQKTRAESDVAAANSKTQGGILSGITGAIGNILPGVGSAVGNFAGNAFSGKGGGPGGGGEGGIGSMGDGGGFGGPGSTMSPGGFHARGNAYAHGGKVGPASKVGQFLHQTLNKGGNVGSVMKAGGKVPGEAKVSGDSRENDTVAAKLSPGEIVIPRSVVNGKDPVKGAADFVAAVLARSGTSLPKGKK